MMVCRKAQELIHSYLDGEIGSAERRGLEEHLEACAGCRRELEATRALLGMVAEVPRRQVGDDFDRALRARLAAVEPQRSTWARWSRLWQFNAWRARPALIPAAVALAAVAVFQALPPAPTETPHAAAGHPVYHPVYVVSQCAREHEAAVRWHGLPEAAVHFNLEASSAASVADDLIQ
jgi:anti-sigma factor RsiW